MKALVVVLLSLVGSIALADIKNVSLRIEGPFDSQNSFVDCAVKKALSILGESHSLYAIMDATPVGKEIPSEFASLRFATKNSENGKQNIFSVQLQSLDQQNKWLHVGESSGRVFMFSTSVSSEAFLVDASANKLGNLDISTCQ